MHYTKINTFSEYEKRPLAPKFLTCDRVFNKINLAVIYHLIEFDAEVSEHLNRLSYSIKVTFNKRWLKLFFFEV